VQRYKLIQCPAKVHKLWQKRVYGQNDNGNADYRHNWERKELNKVW